MRRVLIVSDHPSLHRGFATVGRHIARGLHASGWHVRMIGRYPPASGQTAEPYQVFDADAARDIDAGAGERLGVLLQELIAGDLSGKVPELVLCIGTDRDQLMMVDALDASGLRSRVRLTGYLPVNYAPLPPATAGLLARLDVLVPYTAYARRAFAGAGVGGGRPILTEPIPHGVDIATFHPPCPEARLDVRQRRFGLADDAFLVGYFGRNSRHKRPDLAIRIFATFSAGTWSRCGACSRLTPHTTDPIDHTRTAAAVCRCCGSEQLGPGSAHPGAHLYLHTENLDPAQRAFAGGWDLRRLVRASGVSDRVHLDPTLRLGEGVPPDELALRMGAIDAHLLPFEGGGWELTVLETGACGVPNVITGHGAPPEYAAPFSLLVPPAARLMGASGVRAFMGEGDAVDALLRLASNRGLRADLGGNGPTVAARYSWDTVVRAWDARLHAELVRTPSV